MNKPTGKKPPMAQAIRAFIAGMDFPAEPEENESAAQAGLKLTVPESKQKVESNLTYAGVILALLSFAKGLRLDDTEVSVDPSVSQLAAVCHCSGRTISRTLEKLQKHGMVFRTVRHGHLSSLYTIRKHSRPDKDVQSTKKIRHDNAVQSRTTARPDNPVSQTGQPLPLDLTTTTSRPDIRLPSLDKASGVKASGVKPLGDTSENVSSGSSSGRLGSAPGTIDAYDDAAPLTKSKPDGDDSVLRDAPAQPQDGDDASAFYCPRCNEGNSELMPDHLCTQCLRLMVGGLKAPRTPEEGRLHMVLMLEAMDDDERQRFYASDLTCAESDWIRECGMFFADELKKWEYNARTEELMAESEATNG